MPKSKRGLINVTSGKSSFRSGSQQEAIDSYDIYGPTGRMAKIYLQDVKHMIDKKPNRRSFLKAGGAGVAGLALFKKFYAKDGAQSGLSPRLVASR